jgi:hypothetical protein
MRSRLFVFPLLILCLCWSACSSPPPPPGGEKFFADAKANLDNSDFEAAIRNLERAIEAEGDKPLGQQATMARVALLIAMAQADRKMADTYETSRHQPIAAPRYGQLTQTRTDYYGKARVHLLNALETVMKQRGKLGDKPMPLAMKFPSFSGAENPVMMKILKGMEVSEDERVLTELEVTRNALATTLAGLVGAGDNVHKGQEIFAKGAAEIDPRVYIVRVTESFHKLSEIFGPKALDDTRFHKTCLEVVRDNLDLAAKMLAAQPDKELESRIKKCREECEKQLKKLA